MSTHRPPAFARRSAAAFVRSCRAVLFDFDGPLCALFSRLTGAEAAAMMRAELGGLLPRPAAVLDDPFDVLEQAAAHSDALGQAAERALTGVESRAVQLAQPAPGAHELVRELAASGHSLAVVSNNAPGPIAEYLLKWDLAECFSGIIGRADANIALLKPDPAPLRRALSTLGAAPGECCFIGDSLTDVMAARAAQVPFIALAAAPGRAEQFAPHQPEFTVGSMRELDS